MRRTGICPKCNGNEVLQIEGVTDQIGSASIGLEQVALVCVTCGLIEFYARDVNELLRQGFQVRRDQHPFR